MTLPMMLWTVTLTSLAMEDSNFRFRYSVAGLGKNLVTLTGSPGPAGNTSCPCAHVRWVRKPKTSVNNRVLRGLITSYFTAPVPFWIQITSQRFGVGRYLFRLY